MRPARNEERDRELLRRLFADASPDSLYFRFFHTVRQITEHDLDLMLGDGDESTRYALLCLVDDTESGQERCLAIGNYVHDPHQTPIGSAEVAFFVSDAAQGKGLGTLLLEHLAQNAWRHGFREFIADVLGSNRKMLQVFHDSGYEIRERWESGAVRLSLPLGETERSRALAETREKLATAASLVPFFQPKTVAVIGASRDPSRLGHLLLRHIIEGGFSGTVYPVNPAAHAIASVRAYGSVRELPEPLDLAVVVVPAAQVLQVIDDCVAAHVRSVLVTSAGFAESGEEGRRLEQELLRRLGRAGIRLIGPNCLGLLNTSESVRLNASFAGQMPLSGPVAIASQSGGLGIAILDYASRLGIGVSGFASMGNKPDVSGNDLILYWEDDPATKLIVLHLESFGDPRRFSRVARRVTPRKPILVVKSARTPRGREASGPHSQALRNNESAVEGLFAQTGVIRANTLEELFDVALLLSGQPLPPGRRVAVVTNTAGAAVITVDTVVNEGLEVASLEAQTLARIEEILAEHDATGHAGNPVDLGFSAPAEAYRLVLEEVLADPGVDAVVVLFIPVGVADSQAVVDAMSAAVAAAKPEKPVLANLLVAAGAPRQIPSGTGQIPVYPFPELAVRALARAAGYAEFCRRPRGHVPDLVGVDVAQARSLAQQILVQGEGWVGRRDAWRLLALMGIRPVAQSADSYPEMRLGLQVLPDPLFGPLIGMRIDHRDVVRITPLTDLDAEAMAGEAVGVENVAVGAENAEVVVAILTDLLLRLSRLAEEIPEVRQVILPSVRLTSSGYLCDGPEDGLELELAKPD